MSEKTTHDGLPDPPWRVLATHEILTETRWWEYRDFDDGPHFGCQCGLVGAASLTVIQHPRNDPEAVAIIEAAKTSVPPA